MLLLVVALVVVGIVFAVGALAVGRLDRMAPAPPDSAGDGLPAGPLAPEDIAGTRFGLALRGYRMNEVDAVLRRLAGELAARDDELDRLRSQQSVGGEVSHG